MGFIKSSLVIATVVLFLSQSLYSQEMYLTLPNQSQINRSSLEGKNPTGLLPTQVLGQLNSIALDLAAGKMYWAEGGIYTGPGKIRRADLSGANIEDLLLLGNNFPLRIKLDLNAGKIYFAETDRIARANLDGSNVETVISNFTEIQDIALDLTQGKIYVATSHSIQKANLNGSMQELFLNSPSWGITAMSIYSGKLYWASLQISQTLNRTFFSRINLDGSNFEVINNNNPLNYHFVENFDFDSVANQIYANINGGIYRMGLDIKPIELVFSDVSALKTLAMAPNTGQIYWCESSDEALQLSKIRRGQLNGTNIENLLQNNPEFPTFIALDLAAEKMYRLEKLDSNQPGFRIRRTNLDGSQLETTFETRDNLQPTNFTIDAKHQKLYWTSWVFGASKLFRLSTNGGMLETIQTNLNDPNVESIVLDLREDLIFLNTPLKIYKASLHSGSSFFFSMISSAHSSGRMQLDTFQRNLYFIALTGESLKRIHYDGSAEETLFSLNEESLLHNLALDLASQKVYWIERSGLTSKIRRADINGSNLEDLVEILYQPADLELAPMPAILASDPISCSIDAREDQEALNPSIRHGLISCKIEINRDIPTLSPSEIVLSEFGGSGSVPTVLSVEQIETSKFQVNLSEPLEAGAWTCIQLTATPNSSCFGFLPGDVNADRKSTASDILRLIDKLNGVLNLPIENTDIDRSGTTNSQDILREIELLQGVSTSRIWIGQELPPCPNSN